MEEASSYFLGPITKNESLEGKARAVGVESASDPFKGLNVYKSSIPAWREYFSIYKSHAIVHGAINKLVFASTSAGFDFVPRDSRVEANMAEVRKLKKFFKTQIGFIAELRSVYLDLMVFGNGYLYVVPDRSRRPAALKRVAPYTMRPITDQYGVVLRYEQINPDQPMNADDVIKFMPHEIIHVKFPNPINDVIGLPPLEAIRLPVLADISAQQFNIAFFQNSGVTGTIIAISNADPTVTERNKKFLMENYMGLKAAHRPLVVEGDSIKIEKAVVSHSDMAFLDGRRFLLQEILAVLDVPPAKIGIMETANRSNSLEQDKTFRTEAVTFIQFLVAEAINDHFIRPVLGIQDTVFRHQQSDSRDALESMEYYDNAIRNGSMTINEVRGELGRSPIEGGDVNIIQTSVGAMPVSRIEEFFVAPVPPPGTKAEAVPKGPPEGRNRATGSSFEPAKNWRGAYDALNAGKIEKAYSYAYDLEDDEIQTLLVKALQTENPVLRRGYVERGLEILEPKLQGVTHVGI